jgi:CRISPR/Cas system-associated endonuclease Cas3-HD
MTTIKNEFFAQEDIESAIEKIERQQKVWKKSTGLAQNKFRARNMLVWLNKLTQSEVTALLHEWGS